MKNTIIVILILICCGLGFMVYQGQNNDKSVFEKQKECSSLYQSVKNYLTEEHSFNLSDVGKSEVGSVKTRYNKKMDTCLAETTEYVSLWGDGTNDTFTVYSLYDVYNGYKLLEDCSSNHGCQSEFINTVDKYK